MLETEFNALMERAKSFACSSMQYIDYSDCEKAETLCDSAELILLLDASKDPAMLHFAARDFDLVAEKAANLQGKLRIHFVPRSHAPKLAALGFSEWGEYVDFWNLSLADTAARFQNNDAPQYLDKSMCKAASELSQKCRMQSRGFEGETTEWFSQWIEENKVLVQKSGAQLMGFCCVSIYNQGQNLWIRELAVHPDFQGRGIGKRLMQQAIGYGVEKGASKGFLAADILNRNAIGLYEKYDFHAKDTESELQMIRN